jgi:methylase of polypeptide subunit release factors
LVETLQKTDARQLRSFLDAHDYNSANLIDLLGAAVPPRPEDLPRALYLTREANTVNALARLFLIGTTLDAGLARDALPAEFIDTCIGTGLIEQRDGRYVAAIVIVPIDDLLIASDAFRVLGGNDARQFVLPASTHSANYLRHLTMRESVGRVLDLGCGCGIHALFAASHANTVIATDISAAALRYTEFNAALNGIDNIECRAGNLFEPVSGERFDLILCNPPFVLGPDDTFVYRDNPVELDGFCASIVREAPAYLNDGACLQMLCESVEIEGEPWHERIQSWVRDSGCDAWLLHSPAVSPPEYVARRSRDIVAAMDCGGESSGNWLAYFEDRGVRAVHPGMLVLRRRDGDNWVHVHNHAAEVATAAGNAVCNGIRACDYLHGTGRGADGLLGSVLGISPELTLEQQFGRHDGGWQPRMSVLRMTDGLSMSAEVDLPVMAFLNQLDGRSTLRQCIEDFAGKVGGDAEKLTADLLPIVRLFVGRGFLLPPAG